MEAADTMILTVLSPERTLLEAGVSKVTLPGSTDVGDCSWLVPTAQIGTATWPAWTPGHSWQNVSCGNTSISHKATLLAGKVLAATAIDLIEKPDVLQAAKDEYEAKMKRYGGYFCPVPTDAVPAVPGEKM